MTSVRVHFGIILMSLILASCAWESSTRMEGRNAADTQERPAYNATAASDVDSKGGLTREQQSQ
jgi:hypothetical protein